MPTTSNLKRAVADRATRYKAGLTSPPAPGFGVPSPDRIDRNATQAKQMRSRDALFGRTTYYAGPSHARYSSYPGTGLEPEMIWNLQILRNTGYPQLWTELCEQILERDGHLAGIFDTRRLSVSEKPLRVHPAYRGDELSDVIAKIVERIVEQIDDFDQATEDLLSASAYGYSIAEIVWHDVAIRIPTMDGSMRRVVLTVPHTIEWLHWKHVRFDRWTDEPYLWFSGGELAIPDNKFVFHSGVGTGLVEKRGFMGACVWLSAAKRWSERDWLIYGKIFGIPNIMAQYPDGTEEYDLNRTKYAQFLKDWGEGIPALLPDDLTVTTTREPGGRAGDVHGAIIGWANSEMSKRVTGSTLTVEIGNVGAYAAADTHRDAPYIRTRADAKKLSSCFRRYLFKPILRVNQLRLADVLGFDPSEILERVPTCSRRIEREMTPSDRQKVYEGAVNELGLPVDENQYRDEMGLDAPPPGGKALRGKPVPIGTGGLAPSIEASEDGADPAPKPEDTPARPALPAPGESQAGKRPRGKKR